MSRTAGEMTIHEDGLFPGWVTVYWYPPDDLAVRQWEMCSPWNALRSARALARGKNAPLLVWVKRKNGRTRGYWVGKVR